MEGSSGQRQMSKRRVVDILPVTASMVQFAGFEEETFEKEGQEMKERRSITTATTATATAKQWV
jgi:hypothetical protein